MSHVVEMEIQILSLEALEAACRRLGLIFDKESRIFNWYGEHVGDYALPQGFSEEEMGRCDVGEIRFTPERTNGMDEPYSVGVCRSRTGEGFTLLWDFWCGGNGLQDAIGEKGVKLADAYAVETTIEAAIAHGYCVTEEAQQDGSINVFLRR